VIQTRTCEARTSIEFNYKVPPATSCGYFAHDRNSAEKLSELSHTIGS